MTSTAELAARYTIAVIGLGYVGLPVAAGFARGGYRVIGFDIDRDRIAELRRGFDRTGELSEGELAGINCAYSSAPKDLRAADVFIITVPTPVDAANNPDLRALRAASDTVGAALRPGAVVVYESTVYPGATEEECVPRLERASGLACGRDFAVGYSPERINPGDRTHRFESIVKVVSAQDAQTLDIVAALYGSVVRAGVFRAASIRIAEMAKVIENTQRDINIALMNELSEICGRLGIDTGDVLAAAGTKWNFLDFRPGLVGGHCIGVDPYYLTYRAAISGYHPEVILAGRRINDRMGQRIALECIRLLAAGQGARRVAVLGLTFKENVPDIRNSKVVDIVAGLRRFGVEVAIADPVASAAEVERGYGIAPRSLAELGCCDAVILAVPHAGYVQAGWDLVAPLLREEGGAVIDVKGALPRDGKPANITLWRL